MSDPQHRQECIDTLAFSVVASAIRQWRDYAARKLREMLQNEGVDIYLTRYAYVRLCGKSVVVRLRVEGDRLLFWGEDHQ